MEIRARLAALCLAAALWPAGAGAATLEVEFKGVEGALLENVRALSSLRRLSGSSELDEAMVGRLVQRAPAEARTALRPYGYYSPEVTAGYRVVEGGWHATVTIDPGPPVLLTGQDIEVTGPGRDEPFIQRALAGSRLRNGAQLSHPDYEALKGALQRAALSHGYLDARFTESELAVDPGARTATATLTLDTGERYRFGPTSIAQDVLEESLVRRYLRWDEGDWYDADALLRTQFALDDSQYFSLVEVVPDERDRERHVTPVTIRAEPNRRNVWSIGAGYGTDTGARGTLGWEDRRLNPRGHRLRAELRGSEVDTSAGLVYLIPWSDPALEKLAFEFRQFEEERADVETSGTRLRGSLTQVRGNWQRVLSLTLDNTEDDLRAGADSPRLSRNRSTLLVPGIAYARLPPNYLGLDAIPRGFRVELLASSSALGSDTEFARLVVADERRFQLTDAWRLQLRAEVGTSLVAKFRELPAQYRFFAGGDQSVRGYGYQELSPRDADGNQVGGRNLLTGSIELQRDLPRNFVAAVFVDGGNAFNEFGDPLQYSAGVGLRYRLPFLSIGIDVAQSISEPDRSPRLHLNFTPEF